MRNALAAAAVAIALDIDLTKIKAALESIEPVKGRLNFVAGLNNALLIDDTYNANRDSMKAAIDVLSHKAGKKIVVMGDLFESGEKAQAIHEEIGCYARQKSVDRFYAVGELCKLTINSFGENGKHFRNKMELIEQLKQELNADSIVLIKGSRGMRMEEVVQQLRFGA